METYFYRVFEEFLFDPEIGHYRAYGIELTAQGGETARIADISVSREQVERMAAAYNRHQLFPVHFLDAVEDMLAEDMS